MKNLQTTAFYLFSLIFICSIAASGDIEDLRKHAGISHLRGVSFVPGTDVAFAAGFEGHVLRSDDGGVTWRTCLSASGIRFFDIQAIDADFVAACGTGGVIHVSDDGGSHWQALRIPTQIRMTTVWFTDRNTGWLAGDDGLILHTSNGGKGWEKQISNSQSGIRSIRFWDSKTGICAGYEGVLLKTDDGGMHWVEAQEPRQTSIYAMELVPSSDWVYTAGSFGTILRSPDRGKSWTQMGMATTNFLRAVAFSDPGHGISAGYGWILMYDSKQDEWTKILASPGYNWHALDMNQAGRGIAAGQWGCIATTTDYGITWKLSDDVFSPDLNAITADSAGNIVAAGAEGFVLISNDSGSTFRVMWLKTPYNIWSACSSADGCFTLCGADGWIYQTSDSAATWTQSKISTRTLRSVWISSAGTGCIAGDGSALYSTIDGGKSWKDLSLKKSFNINGIIFISPEIGWLYGDEGTIMESKDGGSSWIGQYTGVTSSFIAAGFSNSGRSTAITYDGFALQSEHAGSNSSWSKIDLPAPIRSVSPDGRVLCSTNGKIYNSEFQVVGQTGVSIRAIVPAGEKTYLLCGEQGYVGKLSIGR